ncbi:sialate O-acetylesterase [Staphylococcus edaphicus]|uniref:Acetylxylan esterase n=1 Tax=Staphylococcus edaphicus TaxID=1955013 RepID=A0A2C6WNT9_9STAP|nr:sialate O-acetylesterase [Staphylococcus edaphicus]PHK49426.1 acetylxylan esterase [Staphylococcus edaphicus]UQW81249.1 sialate O-acetylesterase [Staphylococcus edaphicus]
MKSILLVGQSNMAGRGFVSDVPPIIDERIMVLKNGRWQMMEEPIHSDRSVAGIGPAASFATLWLDAHPDETIGLIPCADGGTSIDEWSPDQILTRHAIAEAKFAQETSEIIGVLWHQGESDSLNQRHQSYANKLEVLIDYFRAQLNLPDVPFIVGLLPDFLGEAAFGQSAVEYLQINEALKDVAESTANCYYVTAQGLTANPDAIHINATSQRLLGMRYFAAFSKRVDITQPLSQESDAERVLYKKDFTKNEQMYLLVSKFSKNEITYDAFIEGMAELQ